MQKLLLTGINSFAGSHLVDYILQNHKDVKIHGTIRQSSRLDNIQHNLRYISLHRCNLLEAQDVNEVISLVKPDKVFHLAAQSSLVTSWSSPRDTFKNNILSQCNLFEAIRKYKSDCKVLICGSSEEYGAVSSSDLPVTEETLLRPLSPYAVSKVTQDLMAFQYFKSYGLHTIRTRAFNHSGARRPAEFVDSGFAKQVAEIELGLRQPVLYHGNLDAIRDFIHVKDVVRAYWIALDKCQAGDVYNICSECGTKISEILTTLLLMTDAKIETKLDGARLRPSDVPARFGDCSKFKQATGWKVELSYRQALEDMLNYWREK